ncbi:hypothetical protein QQS21_011420 [Conoideocrella luteorostrata]|uniref:Uncharacterized protein n=1 Tax=Conoideocrella luteorostrata TaxID=1105319 RepID=A0AAJ0CDE2_9HYPO|nr:hypothetical protein QQS21_011420 [Conoideocrella luteorostrata]
MKPQILSIGLVPTILLGWLIPCVLALNAPLEHDVGHGQGGRILAAAPEESPPDYEAPTYGYGYPPPYQYETSTLTSSTTSFWTHSISNVVTATSVVTVSDQSSSTSDPWVDSSVLGITGTLTSTTSTMPGYSASTTPTFSSSEAAKNTSSSLSLPTSTPHTSTDNGVTDATSSTADASSTLTKHTTATVTKDLTLTSWASSETSFESSQLPVTASSSSTDNFGSVRTNTSTRYFNPSTYSDKSRTFDSRTTSTAYSPTVTEGNPRTKTYFSSQWANSTVTSTPGASIPSTTQHLSIPLTTVLTVTTVSISATVTNETQTVPLSSGVSPSRSFQTTPNPPFPTSANTTSSYSRSSDSPWYIYGALKRDQQNLHMDLLISAVPKYEYYPGHRNWPFHRASLGEYQFSRPMDTNCSHIDYVLPPYINGKNPVYLQAQLKSAFYRADIKDPNYFFATVPNSIKHDLSRTGDIQYCYFLSSS